MAIVFPASPSVNETFTEGSITYKWDGAKWIGLGITPTDRLVEGVNKLEIDGSNNLVWTGNSVGIGTASPDEKMEIGGSGAALKINNSVSGANVWGMLSNPGGVDSKCLVFTARGGANTLGGFSFDSTDGTDTNTIVVIKNSGRLGIGTDDPEEALEVYGDARFKAPDGSHGIELFSDIGGLGYQRIISWNRTTSEYEDLSFGAKEFVVTIGSTSKERLRITSGGVNLSGLLKEEVNIIQGPPGSNPNIDLINGMVHLFTEQISTGSTTPNIRVDGSTSLNASMSIGEAITVVMIITDPIVGYYPQITIDSNAVTEEWLGGSAPSTGANGGYDVYTYNIIKTADATFVVLANLVNFA